MVSDGPAQVGHVDVECPACGQKVRVDIVARERPLSEAGTLRVGLETRWRHECPPAPGDGERLAS